MSKKNPIGESDFSLSCTHDMMNIAPFSNPILFSKKHNCKHSFYIINFIRCINFKPHFQLPLLTPEKESNQRGAAEIQAINSYEATVCVGWPSFDSIHMDPSCAGVNFLACCPYLDHWRLWTGSLVGLGQEQSSTQKLAGGVSQGWPKGVARCLSKDHAWLPLPGLVTLCLLRLLIVSLFLPYIPLRSLLTVEQLVYKASF